MRTGRGLAPSHPHHSLVSWTTSPLPLTAAPACGYAPPPAPAQEAAFASASARTCSRYVRSPTGRAARCGSRRRANGSGWPSRMQRLRGANGSGWPMAAVQARRPGLRHQPPSSAVVSLLRCTAPPRSRAPPRRSRAPPPRSRALPRRLRAPPLHACVHAASRTRRSTSKKTPAHLPRLRSRGLCGKCSCPRRRGAASSSWRSCPPRRPLCPPRRHRRPSATHAMA